MRQNVAARSLSLSLVAVVLSLAAVAVVLGTEAEPAPSDAVAVSADHPVVGRFSITSEAGGAVWSFQPSGSLVVTGPGELVAEGRWTVGPAEREFDATVDVAISGQALAVLGEVAPDGTQVAIHVQATPPERPDDAVPWPPLSRLVGERLGMVPEGSPSPAPLPAECERPDWIDGEVDWDRCDLAVEA
jgi:hypothetical protein